MTTSTLEVGDLFSVLGAYGIEKQLRRIAGVGRVSVNPVSGSTTVMYDPERTNLPAIQAAINDCGFHCAGEALPKHVCEDHAMPGRSPPVGVSSQTMPAHSQPSVRHAPMAATGKEVADAMANHKAHGGEKSDAMAQEMGHGAGMDMQAMVRDMRNRFWIALAFSLPIFAFSPMGMDFIKIPPPFGLRLDLVLFVLASAAILYPVWPFIVAAYRALRSGVANMAVLVVLSVGTGYLFSVGSTFFMAASSSTRRRPSCWSSSCSDTGSKCAQGPARPKPSAPSWTSRRPKRPLCVTARSWRCRPRRSFLAMPS
jgi:Cu2+-exporting ATPase